MLKIKNVSAISDGESVLSDINLEVNPNEVHVILGPPQSGKSALCHAITGHPSIQVTIGEITWNKKRLNNLRIEDRNQQGIYISFQTPPDFDNISNNEITQKFFSTPTTEISDLPLKYNECCELLGLGGTHGSRQLNAIDMDLSQVKRNELVYMYLSNPKLIILDDIDEGMNEDEINKVGLFLQTFLKENDRSCIIVTHNKKLLELLNPTHMYVMISGKLKKLDDVNLYKRVIEDGYSEFS
jgi:Fe-S cluster assembly ATP-binding protein